VRGQEPEPEEPRHYTEVFVGFATETGRDAEDDETSPALGLEYGRRLSPQLGLGGLVEWVSGEKAFREWVFLLVAHRHLNEAWILTLGAGTEIARIDGNVEFALRLGVAYKFLLSGGWNLAPDLNADFLTNGSRTLVYGLVVGKEF